MIGQEQRRSGPQLAIQLSPIYEASKTFEMGNACQNKELLESNSPISSILSAVQPVSGQRDSGTNNLYYKIDHDGLVTGRERNCKLFGLLTVSTIRWFVIIAASLEVSLFIASDGDFVVEMASGTRRGLTDMLNRKSHKSQSLRNNVIIIINEFLVLHMIFVSSPLLMLAVTHKLVFVS